MIHQISLFSHGQTDAPAPIMLRETLHRQRKCERVISEYERDCGRKYRAARKAMRRGKPLPLRWTGSFGAIVARMCVFISLDSAALMRRAGKYHMVRYALEGAEKEHQKWISRGGYLP